MNKPVNCPFCDRPTLLVTRPFHARRGERSVHVEVTYRQCTTGCVDPETGEAPFEFADSDLGVKNAETIGAAWRDKYGEDPPKKGRPGRKTEDPRTVQLRVMVSEAELDAIDRLRGSLTRSEYLRRQALPSGEADGANSSTSVS